MEAQYHWAMPCVGHDRQATVHASDATGGELHSEALGLTCGQHQRRGQAADAKARSGQHRLADAD
jgi:hypothetical protein